MLACYYLIYCITLNLYSNLLVFFALLCTPANLVGTSHTCITAINVSCMQQLLHDFSEQLFIVFLFLHPLILVYSISYFILNNSFFINPSLCLLQHCKCVHYA